MKPADAPQLIVVEGVVEVLPERVPASTGEMDGTDVFLRRP